MAGHRVHTSRAWRFALAAVLAAAGTPGVAPTAAPQQPAPVFRAGVDLLTLDVTALDDDGRQVRDLEAGEFVVEVNGRERRVASVEYVPAAAPRRAGAAPPAAARDRFYSTNALPESRGRQVLMLVDQ